MNKLNNILDESLLHSASGDRKALRSLLKKVIPDRHRYYHESRAITRQEEYADLLYKTLLLELDEEEEESTPMCREGLMMLRVVDLRALLQSRGLTIGVGSWRKSHA